MVRFVLVSIKVTTSFQYLHLFAHFRCSTNFYTRTDTTTKSSPEKSCSPREQSSASPYSNYAQHLYVSTTTSGSSNLYSNLAYTSPAKVNQNAPLGFNNKNKTPSYYDQYKQPKSQDSDYNSSVGSNPNSPYQSQHSPYQAENSPYQNSQTSPYTQQPNSIQSNASTQQINPNSPNSPYQNQHSPYNQNSDAIQNANNYPNAASPYSQTKADSPYQQENSSQIIHQQNISQSLHTSPEITVNKINNVTINLHFFNCFFFLSIADGTLCKSSNEYINTSNSITN